MRRVVVCVLLAACATEAESELAPSGPVEVGKGDGFCPTVPARIAPTGFSQYSCGRLDAVNSSIAADVNRFWGSNVVACACGPDFPQGCVGAWSLFNQGYIYIGVDFVNGLAASGSLMPAQYVFAHEFGHEIQGRYLGLRPTTQRNELQADCLGGYYLGSLVCRNGLNVTDVVATLATACIIADGTGNPFTDINTHGTCEQRAEFVAKGMRAYLDNELPLAACAL
jgi:hypothetical protein